MKTMHLTINRDTLFLGDFVMEQLAELMRLFLQDNSYRGLLESNLTQADIIFNYKELDARWYFDEAMYSSNRIMYSYFLKSWNIFRDPFTYDFALDA